MKTAIFAMVIAFFSLLGALPQAYAGNFEVYSLNGGYQAMSEAPVSTGVKISQELVGRLTNAQLNDVIYYDATIPFDWKVCSTKWSTWGTHIIFVECSTESVALKDGLIQIVSDGRTSEPKETFNPFAWVALAYLGVIIWGYKQSQKESEQNNVALHSILRFVAVILLVSGFFLIDSIDSNASMSTHEDFSVLRFLPGLMVGCFASTFLWVIGESFRSRTVMLLSIVIAAVSCTGMYFSV